MYRCHLNLYTTGDHKGYSEVIKGMKPLENFTHDFFESSVPEKSLTEKADAIFLFLKDINDLNDLKTVLVDKKGTAVVVVLAEKDCCGNAAELLSPEDDLWVLPMTDNELKFRLTKWQKCRKADKDFWETKYFLESTINSIPNLVWYKTKDGIHEKVNDSFCKTVGKTKEQVEGRDHAYIWDVDPSDTEAIEVCAESDRLVMEGGATCTSEETVLSGNETKLLTTYKSPLYDLDGSVMGTVGVAIDITKERSYENEIIEKNKTLESLFATIDCGVICQTVSGSRIISINHAALEILGYRTVRELENSGFNIIAPTVVEEDKPKLKEAIRSLKNIGDSVNIEYCIRHSDGKIIHIMGTVKLLEENGELVYQRFLVDCTSQRIQENNEREALKKYHANLTQALTVDYSLVCCIDLETGDGYSIRVEDCEMKVLNTLFAGNNINIESALQQYADSCIYAEDREHMRAATSVEGLRHSLEGKDSATVNYRTLCGGEIRYFQMKAVRTGEWGSGVVLGFRCIDEEIHAEIKQKNALEEALMQANRANKAKSVFLSNMSHDIRTPMNAIVGFTALAMAHLDKKEQVADYLQKIMTSGNHLLSLINDVLDMSRIESGKMHLDENACSLSEVLHGLRNIIQADINSKQLDLYMDTVGISDEEVICDKLRLNQILLNMLSNAVKYTPAGGVVSIRVSEKPSPEKGKAIFEFVIKDTGIGMSEEFVANIFEPFERERNSTISRIQGTGLGMAITKNIVTMMNGDISVKSKQGVGTEVTVRLPFTIDTGAKKPEPIPELKNCRALVVDDDFTTCDSVSLMLQQLGLRAEWTLSGKEAVLRTKQAVSRGDSYNVYIIDWLLPDMNGVEVIRRVRKELNEEVPIIVLTAYDWSDIEEEAKDAGASAFCSKPLFFSELSKTLHSIVAPAVSEKKPVKNQMDHQCRAGRLLLAEDVELNQEIAVAILSEGGFTVDVAENGQIALDMLRKSEPGYYQAVLMDIQMPVMDGYTAAREMRKLENKELAQIPILAMSANAFEEDKQEALKSGMNGHIAKPVDIENLFSTLDEVLK